MNGHSTLRGTGPHQPASGGTGLPAAWLPVETEQAREDSARFARGLHLPDGVGLCSARFDVSRPLLPAQLAVLSPRLQASAPKRQADFLAGRACAHRALARAGHPNHADAPLPVGSDRQALWPAGWSGSISHSSDTALAVVARSDAYRGLGIDVETLMSEELAASVQAGIATPGELARMGEMDGPLALSLLFSAKESLFKTLYPEVRRIMDFNAATLTQREADWLELQLTQDWSAMWQKDTCLRVHYLIEARSVMTFCCVPAASNAPPR